MSVSRTTAWQPLSNYAKSRCEHYDKRVQQIQSAKNVKKAVDRALAVSNQNVEIMKCVVHGVEQVQAGKEIIRTKGIVSNVLEENEAEQNLTVMDAGSEIEMTEMRSMDLLTNARPEIGGSRALIPKPTSKVVEKQILPRPDLLDTPKPTQEPSIGQQFDHLCSTFLKGYKRLNKAYLTFDLQLTISTYKTLSKKLENVPCSWLFTIIVSLLAFCVLTLPLASLRFTLGTLPGLVIGFVLGLCKLIKGLCNYGCGQSEKRKSEKIAEKQLLLQLEKQRDQTKVSWLRECLHCNIIAQAQLTKDRSSAFDSQVHADCVKCSKLLIETTAQTGNFYENIPQEFAKAEQEFADIVRRNQGRIKEGMAEHLISTYKEVFYDALLTKFLTDPSRPSIWTLLKDWSDSARQKLISILLNKGSQKIEELIAACGKDVADATVRVSSFQKQDQVNYAQCENFPQDTLPALWKMSTAHDLAIESVNINTQMRAEKDAIKQRSQDEVRLLQRKDSFREELFFLSMC